MRWETGGGKQTKEVFSLLQGKYGVERWMVVGSCLRWSTFFVWRANAAKKKQAVNSECPIQGEILLLYFVLYQKYTG